MGKDITREGTAGMEKEKEIKEKQPLNIRDVTICDAIAQMLAKAERDGWRPPSIAQPP